MNRRKNKNKKHDNGTISVTGKTFQSISWTSAVGSNVTLSPALAFRLTNIAKAFGYYRFVELRVKLHINASTYAAGYLAEDASFLRIASEVMDCDPSVLVPNTETVPKTMVVSQYKLVGGAPVKWWKTPSHSGGEEGKDQGTLCFGGIASGTVTSVLVELIYTCEFSEPFDADSFGINRSRTEEKWETCSNSTPNGAPLQGVIRFTPDQLKSLQMGLSPPLLKREQNTG